MNKTRSQITVKALQLPSILLEKYSYTAGTVEPLPKHSHQEYQLGMSFDSQGEYFYRGTYYPIPIGILSIIHSGEVHSPSERTYLSKPATFWMMHVNSRLLTKTALEMTDNLTHNLKVPFFTEPILRDRALAKLFHSLCLTLQIHTSQLEKDSAVLNFFTALISHQTKLDFQCYPQEKLAIAKICDYLQDNYQKNLSLDELVDIAGISRFYLSRLFHSQKGISLSAYQTQIRIDRAKKLILKGMPIVLVATATGFYDQSHLGYHFKRLVGTTPGNYKKQQ